MEYSMEQENFSACFDSTRIWFVNLTQAIYSFQDPSSLLLPYIWAQLESGNYILFFFIVSLFNIIKKYIRLEVLWGQEIVFLFIVVPQYLGKYTDVLYYFV